MREKQDLTDGSIINKLISFFLPIAAGTLFQQLYNAVDAVIVGKFVGTVALAAVGGSTSNIINLLIGFFVSLSGGATVVIAQLFGAHKENSMKAATGTAVTFSVVTGLFLTVLGLIFTPQFLTLMKSPVETMADAAVYLRIYFGGVVFIMLFNIESGILRAVGDSRSPFIYLLICCMLNIVLDLVFVIFFKLGVAGVAVATVLSQALSAFFATFRLMRTSEAYRLEIGELGINKSLLQRMMHIGIPAGLQSSMYSVSNLILQVAINLLGTTVVAAWSLSGKIDGFYWAISNAAGVAVTSFAGQNYGAKRIDRVRKCTKVSLILFSSVTILFSVVLLTVGRSVLPVFSNDIDVIEATWTIMINIVPFYITWTLIEIISGVLRGVGDAIIPVIILGIGICLLRVIWVFTVYRLYPTLQAVTLSYPISWIVTDIALIIHYYRGKWNKQEI